MRWVTKPMVTAERGYTPGQIKARIQRGKWRQGIEWVWLDDARMFDLDAIDARAIDAAESQQPRTATAAPTRVVRLR